MPDGAHMTWKDGPCEHLDLDAALARLAAGEVEDGFCIELGEGRIARVEPGQSCGHLVERLEAHRRLCALAGTLPQAERAIALPVDVDPEVKALLDAVRRTR
ncbi:MAG: hypothetical protein MRY64_15895 [Hyphomonadaceae bacterium]|nr:hypothetical protein [Hyphomonadaceae bacterium]